MSSLPPPPPVLSASTRSCLYPGGPSHPSAPPRRWHRAMERLFHDEVGGYQPERVRRYQRVPLGWSMGELGRLATQTAGSLG